MEKKAKATEFLLGNLKENTYWRTKRKWEDDNKTNLRKR
jgi:hypothetical protein